MNAANFLQIIKYPIIWIEKKRVTSSTSYKTRYCNRPLGDFILYHEFKTQS